LTISHGAMREEASSLVYRAGRAAIAAALLAVACALGGCAGGGTGGTASESKLRNLSIVSREGQASCRVRSYLAAEIIRGRTMIAWVWDVYDSSQQRA